VGLGYQETEVRKPAATSKWTIAKDGTLWRRVVPSPVPQAIVGSDVIETLVISGAIVNCAGGGGIPVTRDVDGRLRGVEAVNEKDLATEVIAWEIHVDVMLLLTDVAGVVSEYATPEQRLILDATERELRAIRFSAGSMGPKVEAAYRFVKVTGRRAAIGSPDDALGLLAATSGISVVANR